MTTAQAGSAVHTATPVRPTTTAELTLRPLPEGQARITDGFWAVRQRRNGHDAIRDGRRRLEQAGNLANLRIAAGLEQGEAHGPIFMDSDVAKWLEAVAWEYGREPSEDLLSMQRELRLVQSRCRFDACLVAGQFEPLIGPGRWAR